MNAAEYPYATGDLLEDRNTYFYTPYGGGDFLHAWRQQRDRLMKSLPDPKPAPEAPAEEAHFDSDTIETDALLRRLLRAIEEGRADADDTRPWLQKLLGKFEVTKRVHQAYGPGFRALDPSRHKDAGRYLRLSEVFEKAYDQTGTLPYLNVLLKGLDTLSTLAEELDEAEKARLSHLITREKTHVEDIAGKMDVSL